MPVLVLAVALFLALLSIPVGLPGTWLMICAGLLFRYIVPRPGIGVVAIVGVPVPVVGSVIGAFAGSFLGALVAEYSRGAEHDVAARAASGAAIGRAVAMGLKAAAGCVIAAWLLAAAIF